MSKLTPVVKAKMRIAYMIHKRSYIDIGKEFNTAPSTVRYHVDDAWRKRKLKQWKKPVRVRDGRY